MTLYLNLLEKNISDRQKLNGVILFLNRMQQHYDNSGLVFDTAGIPSLPPPLSRLPTGKEAAEQQKPADASRPANVRVTGETLINCQNTPLLTNALKDGVVAKIPVVLSEVTLQLGLDSQIELLEPVYRLHNTAKQLRLAKCALLQNTNTLFVKGLVKNTIEYYRNSGDYCAPKCGDLKSCTVDIPFQCSTAVIFNGTEPALVIPASVNEIVYRTQKSCPAHNDCQDPDDEMRLNQISSLFYNELPFCELAESKVVEINELQKNTLLSSTTIEVKLVIYLTLKILQYRQVAIPPAG